MSMAKLTLTKVYTTDKKRDGTPIKDSGGRPLLRAAIKAQEYGNRWITGFIYPSQKDTLQEGKTIEAEVSEREFNGQKELVFRLTPPRKALTADEVRAIVREEMADILSTLAKIAADVEAIRYASRPEGEVAETVEDEEPADIPF